jgi:hypothetical protein
LTLNGLVLYIYFSSLLLLSLSLPLLSQNIHITLFSNALCDTWNDTEKRNIFTWDQWWAVMNTVMDLMVP